MSTYTPTRPMMTAAELAEHHLKTNDHGRLTFGDGYDDADFNRKQGWRALFDWGRDGWTLGDPPYVILSTRTVADDAPKPDGAKGCYMLLSVCEGDHTYYAFETAEDRNAAIDYLFLWYAAGSGWGKRVEDFPLTWEDRDRLDKGEIEVDAKWRGPYRQEV